MKIGFIGLGIMGRPMARNLVRAGHDVLGYSRSRGSRDRAREDGIPTVEAISELPDDLDVLVTMLPDGPDVNAVLFHDDLRLRDGLLVIDMSTIAPATTRRLHDALAHRGVRFLDAPVSGGEAGAIEGVLSVMVGGAEEDFEAAGPVFSAVGKTVLHVGPSGSGQVVKAANQLIVAGNIQLVAEALVLVQSHGVDRARALDVLGGGLAGSTALQRKRDNFLNRSYEPGFRLALHNKDLGIVAASASEAALRLPLTEQVSILVASLVEAGHGDLDHSALYLQAERQQAFTARKDAR